MSERLPRPVRLLLGATSVGDRRLRGATLADELPRTSTGKLRRRRLGELEAM